MNFILEFLSMWLHAIQQRKQTWLESLQLTEEASSQEL